MPLRERQDAWRNGDDRSPASSPRRWPALRYALDNRDNAITLAKEMTEAKADDPRAAYIFDEVMRYSAITPDMPVPLDKLAWMQDLLTKTGNLTKPLDLTKLTDDGPRAKALELAGK